MTLGAKFPTKTSYEKNNEDLTAPSDKQESIINNVFSSPTFDKKKV